MTSQNFAVLLLCGLHLLSDCVRREASLGSGTAFTLKIGTLKTEHAVFSAGAVYRISQLLTEDRDDLLVFLEADSRDDRSTALWGHLQSSLSDSPFVTMGESGRLYALSVLVRKTRQTELVIDPDVRVCCLAGSDSAKGIVARVMRVGEDGMLLILGVGLSPKDDRKTKQLESLLHELSYWKELAATEERTLQVVMVGDVNDRLVLPANSEVVKYVEQEVHEGKKGDVTVTKLDGEALERMLWMITTPLGRKELLTWDSKVFHGTAVGGIHKEPTPAQNQLRHTFTFMTDWWRDTDQTPAMLTYKRTPWQHLFKVGVNPLMGSDWEGPKEKAERELVADAVIASARELGSGATSDDEIILTDSELMALIPSVDEESPNELATETVKGFRDFVKLMSNLNRQKWLLEYDQVVNDNLQKHEEAGEARAQWFKRLMFGPWHKKVVAMDEETVNALAVMQQWLAGMVDRIPKTKIEVSDSQTYLNQNKDGQSIYLQVGWLDAVGVGKDGFAVAEFKDFQTDLDILGFDHCMAHARLFFEV